MNAAVAEVQPETSAESPALVVGLGASGKAASLLLHQHGQAVTVVDGADTPALNLEAEQLRHQGIKVHLGLQAVPEGAWQLAVVSPGVPSQGPLLQSLTWRGVPIIGELELGYQFCACPNVAITGTNGKTTTTELVERILHRGGLRTQAAGNIGLPFCWVVKEGRPLDYITLEVSSFQLETIRWFRPSVAVLLNITPDHLDRYGSLDDYRRAKAAIFKNQMPWDRAMIQWEAWAQLKALHLNVPSQVITFSAHESQADLYLDRGWILSRWPDWSGPLLDLAELQLTGPHNAENVMAALAVGLALGIPLEKAVEALRSYAPAPHRCELVAAIGGVKFINDSKATNVDAVRQALVTLRPPEGGRNVWLIAGGKDKGFDYDELGPLLAQRAKGAFLLGETRLKIRSAWSCFTPCTLVDSLLEAVTEAARCAEPGDVVLLSPACSSFDMFQNYQHRGEVFRQAVKQWADGVPPDARRLTAAHAEEAVTKEL